MTGPGRLYNQQQQQESRKKPFHQFQYTGGIPSFKDKDINGWAAEAVALQKTHERPPATGRS
jgi:hypothetical protein